MVPIIPPFGAAGVKHHLIVCIILYCEINLAAAFEKKIGVMIPLFTGSESGTGIGKKLKICLGTGSRAGAKIHNTSFL